MVTCRDERWLQDGLGSAHFMVSSRVAVPSSVGAGGGAMVRSKSRSSSSAEFRGRWPACATTMNTATGWTPGLLHTQLQPEPLMQVMPTCNAHCDTSGVTQLMMLAKATVFNNGNVLTQLCIA